MNFKIKLISLLLAAVFTAAVVMSTPVSAATVEEEVFSFLTDELGLTSAAAAGIMANIMCECSFNPNAGDWDTNDLYSYGLFMWNGPRYERLKKWCGENKLDYTTVNGQMNYLRHELEGSECETLTAMRAIPDTFEGCVDATVLFAELFERCASFSYGLRVYYAVNTFWPSYGTCAPSEKRGIYGVYCNYPVTVKTGDSYTLKGAVVSFTSPLTELSAGVYDANGKMLTGSTAYPSEYVYDITKIDRYVVFGSLAPGVYVYRISASNSDGAYIVEEHEFTVGDGTTSGKYPRITDGSVLCGFGPYCPGAKFTDMPPAGDWAHDGIDYVLSRGLFLGTSATRHGHLAARGIARGRRRIRQIRRRRAGKLVRTGRDVGSVGRRYERSRRYSLRPVRRSDARGIGHFPAEIHRGQGLRLLQQSGPFVVLRRAVAVVLVDRRLLVGRSRRDNLRLGLRSVRETRTRGVRDARAGRRDAEALRRERLRRAVIFQIKKQARACFFYSSLNSISFIPSATALILPVSLNPFLR